VSSGALSRRYCDNRGAGLPLREIHCSERVKDELAPDIPTEIDG
jgi:hypothetical protein